MENYSETKNSAQKCGAFKIHFFLEASRNKRPCKNLQGFKIRNFLRKRKILGSEMRTQAFALHSPYDFFSVASIKKSPRDEDSYKIQNLFRG